MRGVFSAAVAFLAVVPLVVNACDGEEGTPASPSPLVQEGDAAGGEEEGSAEEAAPPKPTVTLGATVQDLTTAAPIPNVLVVVEVGGLNQPNPAGIGADGGAVVTANWDPFFQYSAVSDDAGVVKLSVPGGAVGLHAFAEGYLEGLGGPWDAGPDAGVIPLRLLPEGGASLRPALSGLTAAPTQVAAGGSITFTVVASKPPTGSLSQEVILVQPTTQQAWGLAPPTPVAPTGPYPAGVYSRIVTAPATPGVYQYDVVAASFGNRVASNRVSVMVTVTPDGGVVYDATFPDTAAFLDGRR